MPPELPGDIVAEILFRLPPDDPACLLRASLACKRWRRILADPAFRRRHGALHPTPSVLGFLQFVGNARPVVPYCSRFVPANPASGRPAARDLPGWLAIDCRHGRALFVTPATDPVIEEEVGVTLAFVVWDPLTDERHHLPPPSPPPNFHKHAFNAAVLCAAASGGCDHRGCHRGPFRVAYVFSTFVNTRFVTFASEYSSETGIWSTLTYIQLQPPSVHIANCPYASALVGDTLYFRSQNMSAFEYQLGVQRLSVIDPPQLPSTSMASVDGKLGFFSEGKNLSLCLWLQETALNGVPQWTQARVIKMDQLFPSDALLPPKSSRPRRIYVTGSAEGTDVILMGVSKHVGADIYMVELNSGRSKKVFDGFPNVFPYTSFCIPVTGSGSTGEGPEKDV